MDGPVRKSPSGAFQSAIHAQLAELGDPKVFLDSRPPIWRMDII